MPFIEIHAERLDLVPFAEGFIGPEYLSWLNDPRVVRFSNQRFLVHTAESSLAYLRSFEGTENLFLALRERSLRRVVGTMTAYVNPRHGTADLGILIGDPSSWGRGYGLEAWSTLQNFLLSAGGLRKVTGGTLRGNVGMLRIFERSGMQLEGVRVGQEIVESQPMDALLYARFRSS